MEACGRRPFTPVGAWYQAIVTCTACTYKAVGLPGESAGEAMHWAIAGARTSLDEHQRTCGGRIMIEVDTHGARVLDPLEAAKAFGEQLVRGGRFVGTWKDPAGREWLKFEAGPFRIPE